jgi:hypothetical protein
MKCFGRHTAHYQKPKTAQAASGFTCVEGCRTCSCRTLSGSFRKTRGCFYSFSLLMMGGVPPETCWASCKIRNNKILIKCCILMGFSLRRTDLFSLTVFKNLYWQKYVQHLTKLFILISLFQVLATCFGLNRPLSGQYLQKLKKRF